MGPRIGVIQAIQDAGDGCRRSDRDLHRAVEKAALRFHTGYADTFAGCREERLDGNVGRELIEQQMGGIGWNAVDDRGGGHPESERGTAVDGRLDGGGWRHTAGAHRPIGRRVGSDARGIGIDQRLANEGQGVWLSAAVGKAGHRHGRVGRHESVSVKRIAAGRV